jgi:hypothetical protein
VDEQAVRDRAQAVCDALAAGDIDRATEDFSPELQRNLGEVLGLMPLPASTVDIDSVARGGSGYNVVIRLVGDTDEVLIQTRWKDRDGQPLMVEASHLASSLTAPVEAEGDEDLATDEAGAGG